MGGRGCHPFHFGRPVRPPGPAANQVFCPGARQRHSMFLGVHHGLTLIIRGVVFPATCGLGPPIDPPIDCPREGRYWTLTGPSTENESALLESKIVWRIGYNKMNTPYPAYLLVNYSQRRVSRKKERAAQASGPVRSSSESGVQCLPLRCQAHPRRVPCASPSDLDIDRLKIPLDIGSPPLCC